MSTDSTHADKQRAEGCLRLLLLAFSMDYQRRARALPQKTRGSRRREKKLLREKKRGLRIDGPSGLSTDHRSVKRFRHREASASADER